MMLTTLAMASVLLFGDFADLFEAREHRYTGGQYHNELFRYRLFVPHSMEPTKQYPLLVWLHGAGEAGSDNRGQLAWLNLISNDPEHMEFFILAVQCPSGNPSWFRSHAGADNMLTVTADILQKTMRECPIDTNRIYLAGLSAGGAGCWEMAMRYPDLFAAVVPMASGGGDLSRAAKLKNIPIWAFINEGERKGVETVTTAVQMAGGNAHLTVMQAPGHDSWSTPLRGGILNWMLEQRRDSPCWMPPGYQGTWQWWHILVLPIGVLVFLRLAWFMEQRRRVTPVAVVSESETADTDFSIGPLLARCEPVESVIEDFGNREPV